MSKTSKVPPSKFTVRVFGLRFRVRLRLQFRVTVRISFRSRVGLRLGFRVININDDGTFGNLSK